MSRQLTRHGKILGGYVPGPVLEAVEEWVRSGSERNKSSFLRDAAREKSHRDGIPIRKVSGATR